MLTSSEVKPFLMPCILSNDHSEKKAAHSTLLNERIKDLVNCENH